MTRIAPTRRCLLASASLAALAAWSSATAATASRHEGVATCASTTCHGAARPLAGTPVLQNEYVTWSEFDPHAGAFRTLQNERSAAMAQRLGLGPAERAPACLACHSEVVPTAVRGPRFQQDDGIGCEACHGPASRWLATHDDGAPDSHEQSLRAGLRALNKPAERGALCVSCHVGSGNRLVNHAMLAAGHPRLSFELDTFSELWRTSGGREHYWRSAEESARRSESGATQVWLTGLAVASLASVDQLQAGVGGAALPEFSAFNCYSCHRSMGRRDGDASSPPPGAIASGVTPGALRLNDGALRLLATALRVRDSVQADALAGKLEALQRAANEDRGGVATAAAVLRKQLVGLVPVLAETPVRAADRQAILAALLKASGNGAYADYATAEQAAMAAVVLLGDTRTSPRQAADIAALFAALDDDTAYDPLRFARMLGRLTGERVPRQ